MRNSTYSNPFLTITCSCDLPIHRKYLHLDASFGHEKKYMSRLADLCGDHSFRQ